MTEETLFHEALVRVDPRDRAAFLDAACAGRPDLRAAVKALLAVHDSAGDFLAAPAVADWSDVPSTNAQAGSNDTDDRTRTADPAAMTTLPAGPAGPVAEMPAHIGRYAVRDLLGRGGMGTVYLAHDPELDRPVALKVPKLGTPAAEERFLQEARAAAAVSHPNLCPVHDAGRADGVLYLAMAYVPGRTLGQVLRDEGRLAPARAAALAAGVARGMAEAHRHTIVHRDLKPGNILLDRRGEPVVTDFGLARRDAVPEPAAADDPTAAQDPRLTQAGAILGTPAYMSPEQARGDTDRAGPASDVYSLGAILFEMLTGRVPFRGATVAETLRKIETAPVPPLSGVPAGLATLCRRALALDPADRPPSMDAFAAALAPFAAGPPARRWARVATAAAAVVMLIAAGIVIYVKTDFGTVEVRLKDPPADVRVTLDGNQISISDAGAVTKLRAGAHGLEVMGPGFVTETRSFNVTRGDRTVVEIELKPKGTDQKDLSPDRAKLAALLARGDRLAVQNNFAELAEVADAAVATDPESPGALALRATVRAARRDPAGARADARAACRLNPETYRALNVLAHLNSQEGKFDQAIADLTAAMRLRPDNPLGWANRASAYFNTGEYRQVIADATRAIDLGLPRENALINRGAAHACLGEYDRALPDYAAALAMNPGNAQALAQRSAVHLRRGDPAKAAADWAAAKKLVPGLSEDERAVIPPPPKPPERKTLTPAEAGALKTALAAGQKAWAEEHYEDCRKAAEEACRIDPTAGPARSLRARAWGQLNRLPEAIAEATEAIRLDPADAWGYAARGVARNRDGDHAGAIADYTIALRLDPTNHVTWNNRANAYRQRGQYHQSLADVGESLRLKPTYGRAFTNRGACLLYFGEYEAALADYLKAAAAQPKVAQPRLICAAIYARLGRVEEAEAQRQLAARIDGKVQGLPDVALPPPAPPVKVDPALPDAKPAEPPADRSKLAGLLARGDQLIEGGRVRELEGVVDEALKLDPESPTALGLRAGVRLRQGDIVRA